jgi:hypothetical protein
MPDHFDLTNSDYPVPDPSWDYSQIWHNCQNAKQQIDDLLVYISDFENATSGVDNEIKDRLDAIGQLLNTTRRSMGS